MTKHAALIGIPKGNQEPHASGARTNAHVLLAPCREHFTRHSPRGPVGGGGIAVEPAEPLQHADGGVLISPQPRL